MTEKPVDKTVLQMLRLGSIRQERYSPPDTMYALTGRRIYALGDIDGRFRPRTNPYDLHAYGHAHPKDRLAGKLQGVWAQPVRGISGYAYTVTVGGETWPLDSADSFTQAFSYVEFTYRRDDLLAARRDYAALDLPVLISTITLRNDGPAPLEIHLSFTAQFDLEDAWFTQLARRRNKGEEGTVEDGRLVARAEASPAHWAAAVGAERPLCEARLLEKSSGELAYDFTVEPDEEETFTFAISIDSERGAEGALGLLETGLEQSAELLDERQMQFREMLARIPRLLSPEPALNEAFTLACANLLLLEAEAPTLGRYFYAGLEIFPFWFSNDGAYSISGLLAAGLREQALNHISIGRKYLEKGGVPHQVSPSGKVAFEGNAQETQLWIMSIWDAYRWTGDRDFLAEVYPGALKGMFDYVLGVIDPDGDGYPDGPGMVEAGGMGPEKLDSAVYTWASLHALASIAAALDDEENADRALHRAAQIAAAFDVDWWDEGSGTYAMSLTDDNSRYAVPHWAVIVPLEVGLAAPDHAAKTFKSLQRGYLNQWGLKHTNGNDERVWTLPNATLSRAAYRYGDRQLGYQMLRNNASVLEAGSIGLFHELVPEGACIIQLWSAATFLRGLIEDMMGITVNAANHSLSFAPQLPDDWQNLRLENLVFGEHRVSISYQPGQLTIEHHAGPRSLRISLSNAGEPAADILVSPGAEVVLKTSRH